MQYSIENEFIRLTVESKGAEVYSVVNKHTGAEMLWNGDPEVWPRRAPILFPYTGKLTGGKMIAKGLEYQGPQHGFARDVEHTLVRHTDDVLEFELHADSQTLPIWAYSWFSTLHLLVVDVWSVVVLFRLAAAIAQWPRPQHTPQQESPMKVLWLVALVCSVVLVRLYQASASIQHPGLMQWQTTFQALAIFALPMALVGLCAYTLAPRSKHEKAL